MAKRRQQRLRLLEILVLATAVAAQEASPRTRTISLSSFELIAAFIPIDCLNAYNTPLDSCDVSDFLLGSQCSRSCVQNLRRVEANIQEACSQAKPRAGTLLDRTRDGELIAALCGEDDDDEEPTSTLSQINPGLPTSTTTVTKAITPTPPIASESSTTRTRSTTTTELEETSTLAVPSSSTIPIQPPRSSVVSSETGSVSVPVETMPPTQPTSSLTSVIRPPQSSATVVPRPPPPPANDRDGEDDEDNQDANGNSSGSGGGGLSDIGFEARASGCRPRMAEMAVVAAVVIGWQAVSIL